MEAAGTRVRYLNIGDPVAFGFKTPPHLVEAVERAMRDGHNTYGPSAGHSRRARGRGGRIHRERLSGRRRSRLHHRGHVGRHRAGAERGRRRAAAKCSCRCRPIRCTRRCWPSSDAKAKYYRLDPSHGWMPDLDHLKSLVTPATRALVVIDPNNPTGAVYPTETRRALLDFADAARPADPRRRGLRRSRIRRPGRAVRPARSRRADHLVLEPVEGVSGARLAHGLDGDRPLAAAGRCRGGGEEAGGRPAVQHRADAVRRRAGADRRPIAPAVVPARLEARARAHGRTAARDARRHRAWRRPPRSTRCRGSRCRRDAPTRTT